MSLWVSQVLAVAVGVVIHTARGRYKNLSDALLQLGNSLPYVTKIIFGMAVVFGFASVAAATPGYQVILAGLHSIPGPPQIQLVIAIFAVSAITASGSNGFAIVMRELGEYFQAQGISLGILHRLGGIAAQTFDSLPHQPLIIVICDMARLTFKEGYYAFFVSTVAIPGIVTIIMTILSAIGIFS